LRASARSDKLDAGGSAYPSLDVPDFSKQPLAVTDLLLAYADVQQQHTHCEPPCVRN